jgi:hypothetical protein
MDSDSGARLCGYDRDRRRVFRVGELRGKEARGGIFVFRASSKRNPRGPMSRGAVSG